VAWKGRKSLVLPTPLPSPSHFAIIFRGGLFLRELFFCEGEVAFIAMSSSARNKYARKYYQVAGTRTTGNALVTAKKGRKRRYVQGAGRSVIPIDMVRSGGYSSIVRNVEMKFKDSNPTTTGGNVGTTAVFTLMNGLVPGSNADQRIGRQVTVRSIEGRFTTYSTISATLIQNVRYMVVLDKQANAATPAYIDIFSASNPIALRNISNKKRFKVLWDSHLIALTGNGGAAANLTANSMSSQQFYKKIRIQTQYNSGTAGTVGDITTNAIWFICIGDQASGSGANIVGETRIRYDDC